MRLRPRPATDEELQRFHTPRLRRAGAGAERRPGSATRASTRRSGRAASRSPRSPRAAASSRSTPSSRERSTTPTRSSARPATTRSPDKGMGGCLFGNTALAALHARAAHGVSRVAIVDWDAHHGNGTQAAFYDDPDVLTISLHQADCFPPESGRVDEVGGRRHEHQPPAAARLGHRRLRGGVRARRRAGARRGTARARARRLRLRLERVGPARAADAPQRGLPRADARRCSASPTGMRAGGSS